MRGLMGRLGVVTLAGLFLLAAFARADDKAKAKDEKTKEEKVDEDKIPKKVMAAIKARFPGAKIDKASKETTGTRVVYDIEMTLKGRKYEMDILEDGTVLEVEKQVDFKDLPEAVRKALKAKFPRGKLKVIMEVNLVKDKKETPDHYEVTLETADKKTIEVTVSLDGKTIKGEPEKK